VDKLSFQSNRPETNRLFFEIMQQLMPELPISYTETYADHIQVEVQESKLQIKAFNGEKLCKKQCFSFGGDRKQNQQIKLYLYDFMSAYLNKPLAWGAFTGVKPVKHAHALLRKGYTEAETLQKIREHFHCSSEKADLMTGLALREMPLIYPLNPDKVSLYIGIPLCLSKCTYCSFISTVVDQKGKNLALYLENLIKEIQWTGSLLEKAGKKIDTIYIGGGTPSVLSVRALERLLETIRQAFDLSALREYTFESGRSETTTEDKVHLLKAYGIDRICLNPQSMNEKTLRHIGRHDSIQAIENCYGRLKEAGFHAINMDLILGLSKETPEDFMFSLNRVLEMGPENITIHCLSLKKGSRMKDELGVDVGEGYGETFHKKVMAHLDRSGYLPYYLYRQKYTVGNGENIGYTLPGKEGLYNILMMAEKQSIIGIGAGSSGKLYHPDRDQYYRVFTAKDVKTYNEHYDEILAKKSESYRLYLK
jgi:oxygen-independent coproporphyrinogen-3 oxidase